MAALRFACLLLLALARAHAGEVPPLVVSAERDNYGQGEQQALVFREDQVVFSRNSNFVCGPAELVRLGAFSKDYDAGWKAASAHARQVALRLSQAHEDPPQARSPHRPRFYIGVREVTDSKAYGLAARKIVEQGCDENDWRADDAVEVSFEKGLLVVAPLKGSQSGEAVRYTPAEARCKVQGKLRGAKVFECQVPDFGTALVIESK